MTEHAPHGDSAAPLRIIEGVEYVAVPALVAAAEDHERRYPTIQDCGWPVDDAVVLVLQAMGAAVESR